MKCGLMLVLFVEDGQDGEETRRQLAANGFDIGGDFIYSIAPTSVCEELKVNPGMFVMQSVGRWAQ